MQWRLLTSPCFSVCSCVSVVAFKLLNHDKNWYKSGENILIKLEALGSLNLQFQTLSNKKEEDIRIFEVLATLLTVHIVCATGSWTNVKLYWIYIVIECEIARWRNCICLVKFPLWWQLMTGNRRVNFDTGVNYVHVYMFLIFINVVMWICAVQTASLM